MVVGVYSATISYRLGGWVRALELAGLVKAKTSIEKISDERLLDDLKLVAKQIQKCGITTDEYNERGQFNSATLIRRFGSWLKAKELVDLSKTRNFRFSNEELFINFAEIWRKLGRQPKSADLTSQTSKFSCDTYKARFGSWRKALEFFVAWANEGETQTAQISPQQCETQPTKPSRQQEIQHKPDADGITAAVKPSPKPEAFRRRTPRSVNARLRIRVIMRDNCTCRICGISPALKPGTILEVDHIKSWDAGGETIFDNLQTLCQRCNGGKSNLDIYQK